MNEEMKAALQALREEFGKSQVAVAKITALETSVAERAASAAKLEKEVAALREDLTKAKDETTRTIREARLNAARAEGVVTREHALTILGGLTRQILAQRTGQPIPAAFNDEQAAVREFVAQRTLSAGAVSGSYLVPTITSSEIVDSLEEVSDLISMTDFRPDIPGNVNLSVLTARPVLQHARASVDTSMTKSNPAFGQVQLRPQEGYILFGVDNRLMQMSSIALGTYMTSLLRDGIIEGLANDLLNADGTSAYNSITGLLNQATAAYIYQMPAGKTKFADLDGTHLVSVMSKCLKRGRARGSFLMSHDVLGVLTNLKRDGQVPVITYDAQGNQLVFGRKAIIDEGMPDITEPTQNNKAFFGFGDLATFVVGLVNGIQLASSTDVYFAENQTAFRGIINYDIQRKAVATFITGKTANA